MVAKRFVMYYAVVVSEQEEHRGDVQIQTDIIQI
jgi:hypothetical protein